MGFARRSCALALVLAMSVTLPLGAPRGCVDCPPGCPMHARADVGAERPAQRLGCHRGRPVTTGEVCLRSACGHDVISRSETALQAILHRPARVRVAVSARAITPGHLRLVSSAAPEPPTDPPRAVRG
jgi:hypothetical protein